MVTKGSDTAWALPTMGSDLRSVWMALNTAASSIPLMVTPFLSTLMVYPSAWAIFLSVLSTMFPLSAFLLLTDVESCMPVISLIYLVRKRALRCMSAFPAG